MKIAQVAPLWESVPPVLHGGTERVVSFITEELVRQGHEVTLFASGDSTTRARLVAMCPEALRLSKVITNYDAPLVAMLERAFTQAGEFDIIHSHLEFLPFPLARRCPIPVVTTLHARLDLPELLPLFRKFADLPVVSISNAQRDPMPWANWQATVHHGLPQDLYSFHPDPGKYLVFLGRIAPEKGLDQAIEIAKRVEMPLRIGAKIDPANLEYYRAVIEPLLDHPLIEYVGEVTDMEKDDFLGEAYAQLCPSDWPEPFGLVFIESLACGTPVIAYRRGSLPEIIDHGVTGFTCETLEEMIQSVRHVSVVDRKACRRAFDKRFTTQRMVKDYLKVYAAITWHTRSSSAGPFRSRFRYTLTLRSFQMGKSQESPPPTWGNMKYKGQALREPALCGTHKATSYRLLLGLPPSNPGAFPGGNPLVPLGPPPPTVSSPIEPVASGPF
ncbi:MAG: glycosyltransferase family 4 protein [Nitrospira sp.]|nr:glycosyltransferase family 4 protein [Nitrospira sp.]